MNIFIFDNVYINDRLHFSYNLNFINFKYDGFLNKDGNGTVSEFVLVTD